MAIVLLDTSVIIDTINNKRNRKAFLLELLQQGHFLACCPINITEVYAGMRPKEQAETDRFLRSLRLYPMIWHVAELAGLLKQDYRKKGLTLNLGDVIIAATAIHHNLNLLTDNTKDFPMKELQLHPLPQA